MTLPSAMGFLELQGSVSSSSDSFDFMCEDNLSKYVCSAVFEPYKLRRSCPIGLPGCAIFPSKLDCWGTETGFEWV